MFSTKGKNAQGKDADFSGWTVRARTVDELKGEKPANLPKKEQPRSLRWEGRRENPGIYEQQQLKGEKDIYLVEGSRGS